MITVRLHKKQHNRNRFNCGISALNNYLRIMANQQSIKDNTRTFVLEDKTNPEYIIGYYTLTMISIDLSTLPKQLQKKHYNTNVSGLIARLAVDTRYTKQGYGQWLLVDALTKLISASEMVAFPFVTVDAKDGVALFYKKLGFTPFLDTPNKLFITLKDAKNNLKL